MADKIILQTESFGLGLMSFGTGPAGIYEPATVVPIPIGATGSRYINPNTGDYQIDKKTGHMAQMPKTRQRVLLALSTLKSSATAVPAFGFRPPRKIGSSFDAEMKFAVRSALKHLTIEQSPVIQIQEIIVKRTGASRSEVTVVYIDLLSGNTDQVTTNAT